MPFFLHSYGFLISLGILVASGIGKFFQKKLRKYSVKYAEIDLDEVLLYIIPFGIFGARTYHVIDYWTYYKENLVEIFKIWQGGLGIYGAILGGIVGLWIYTVKNKKDFQASLDLVCVGLPLGQAIGRLGNYFNKELYGIETNSPLGIIIEGKKYHPLFFYESILNLGLFFLLRLGLKKKKKIGFFAGVYFLGYGLIRYGLDFLRIDRWKIEGIGVSQLISIIIFVIGIRLTFARKRKEQREY